jgi:hypothetical protein
MANFSFPESVSDASLSQQFIQFVKKVINYVFEACGHGNNLSDLYYVVTEHHETPERNRIHMIRTSGDCVKFATYLDFLKLCLPDLKLTVHFGERSATVEYIESAFQNRVCTLEMRNVCLKDPAVFIDLCYRLYQPELYERLKGGNLKADFTLLTTMTDPAEGKDVQGSFHTEMRALSPNSDLELFHGENKVDLLEKLSKFRERDCGFALKEILSLRLNINKNDGFHSGAAKQLLPKALRGKKGLINVSDCPANESFRYSVAAALTHKTHKGKNGRRGRKQQYSFVANKLCFNGIPEPVNVCDVPQFEKLNKVNVNIYRAVYAVEGKTEPLYVRCSPPASCSSGRQTARLQDLTFHPYQISEQCFPKTVNLFLMVKWNTDEDEIAATDGGGADDFHFAAITDLNRLVRPTLTRCES